MKKYIGLLFFINLFLFSSLSYAQKQPLFYLGGSAYYNYSMHNADFQNLSLQYYTCCPKYKTASGSGISLGGLFETNVSNIAKGLSVGANLKYTILNADFAEVENIGNVELRRNEYPYETVKITSAEAIHNLQSNLQMINLVPYVSYDFFNNFVGFFGLNLGYMLDGQFSQYEELAKPDNLVFSNGSKKRNEWYNQTIPNLNDFQIGLLFGLGYKLPIGENTFIVPRINYNLALTDVSNVSWKPNYLQLGADIKFPFYKSEKAPKKELIYERDTIVERRYDISEDYIALEKSFEDGGVVYETYKYYQKYSARLQADFFAYGIDKDGNRQENPTIIVEEFYTVEGFPVLPNVYFKDGNSDLNKTRLHLIDKEEAKGFDEKKITSFNSLSVYYDILNIMGSRLKRNPNAKLIVAGYSSGTGADAQNSNIAQERANVVKNYLVNTWGINENRLIVETRKATTKTNNPNSMNDAIEENQCVELLPYNGYNTTTVPLYLPVVLSSIEREANPPAVEFVTNIDAEAGVNVYSLAVEQDNRKVFEANGRADNATLKWQIREEYMPFTENSLNAVLNVKDNIGQTVSAAKPLDIKQITVQSKKDRIEGDWRIDRYSLVLFNYDDANISYVDRQILSEIKKQIIKDSRAVVTVSGYADRTGNAEYNKNLAKRRCDEVCKFLDIKNAVIDPVGSDDLFFNNNLPEGRALSRTVKIEVRTPIK